MGDSPVPGHTGVRDQRNSFESDIPFLAFWMAGVALFVAGGMRSPPPRWL